MKHIISTANATTGSEDVLCIHRINVDGNYQYTVIGESWVKRQDGPDEVFSDGSEFYFVKDKKSRKYISILICFSGVIQTVPTSMRAS